MRRRAFISAAMAGSAGLSLLPLTSDPSEQDDFDALTAPVPKHATALFDGASLAGWRSRKGGPAAWKVENGYAEIVPGSGDIYTEKTFTDFQLHVEFWLPLMPEARGQARANSGVYLQGLYEVQVLDSYGLEPKIDDCGAIYGIAPPLLNACKKPERWQTYDIAFRAPRFDDAGRIAQPGRVTVFHNGMLIHHAQEVGAATRASMPREANKPGPILLQDHGNRVRYRNLWIIPVN
jgi:hypothetical protein